MSTRERSYPFCAPPCHVWKPSTCFALARMRCVAVWCRVGPMRRSQSTWPCTLSPTFSEPSLSACTTTLPLPPANFWTSTTSSTGPFVWSCGPVERELLAFGPHDGRVEVLDRAVLVVERARGRHVLVARVLVRAAVVFALFGLGLRVLVGHRAVEVVRHVHRDAQRLGDGLHDLRVEALRVVQVDELLQRERLALVRFRLALDEAAALLQRLLIALRLQREHGLDVVAVRLELGEVAFEGVELQVHDVEQRDVELEVLHHAEALA